MIWLNPEQLKEIGVSRGITARNRQKWTWRTTAVRGRNGKLIQEVSLESLPEEFKRIYLQQLNSATATPDEGSLTTEFLESSAETVGPADELAATGADGEGNPNRQNPSAGNPERRLMELVVRYSPEIREAFLREAQRLAVIIERYNSIIPKRKSIVESRESGVEKKKLEFVPEILHLCEEAICTNHIILQIEPKRSKVPSPHTLDVWSKAFSTAGLAAFLRKASTPTGAPDKRKADISAGAAKWLYDNWRKKASPLKLHQALEKEAAKHGWTIPAYGWVWRKYNALPKVVSSLVFKGEKDYTGKFSPFVPRTVADLDALQILCGDHSVRDVTVMLPDGTLTRPWLTLWQDMRTGLIWGWHLDLTPSSTTIGLAYVNGVQNFGAQPIYDPQSGDCSRLYTDKGKDYRCKQLTGQTLEFAPINYGKAARIEGGMGQLCTQRKVGFMDELGLKHMLARGYNAREKPVERTHRDISAWEQNTFSDEYCGKDTSHRPDAWVKAWHKHQRLLKKFDLAWVIRESPFMQLDDYREAIAGWINEYNHIEHTRAVLGGAKIIPANEYDRLYTTRYEIAEDTLALLLMKAAKKKIGKDGVQMFHPHWYFLNEAMTEFKGREVEVRWTDGDYSRIWAVLPDHRVVEASLITPSSVVNPNKRTMETVAKQKIHERKLAREYQLVQQSNWRGETVEDRVAQMINPDETMPPEEQKMAVNARPTVHTLNRFDKSKLAGSARSGVTPEQVENANVIEGMFGDAKESPRIKEEWED